MIDFGNGTIKILKNNFSEDETLFSFLERLTKNEKIEFKYKEYKGLGILIEKIGSKSNGENNKYWQYWVNNVYALVAVDTYRLKPNDVVLFKFTNSQQ